jgi:hypothetical protein
MKIPFSLKDSRLNHRAQDCIDKMNANPAASFPDIFSNASDLVGFYRFLNNDGVEWNELVDGICSSTQELCHEESEIIAIHDTSQFEPVGKGEGVKGFGLMSNTKQYGFFGHFSLMVGLQEPIVYGVGEASFWTRNQKQNLWSEKNRWLAHVESVTTKFPWCKVIHVSDRESDSYEYLAGVSRGGCHFVSRACHLDRKVASDLAEDLFTEINSLEFKFKREIEVTKRSASGLKTRDRIHPPREYRQTTVEIGSKAVTLKRSQALTKNCGLPEEIAVNMVVVREVQTADCEGPIEWILFTNEPIDTETQIERAVEIYRKRWMIEEFFKALKTGCSAEKRQMNSLPSWLNMIALMLPIASTILNLRNLKAMTRPEAEKILSHEKWEILSKLASNGGRQIKTVGDAMLEIARLGGYVNRSKPPGWLILSRGLRKLTDYEQGWKLQRKMC